MKRKLCLFLILFGILYRSAPAAVLDKVVLQLRWDHQYQFAGYYAAKWQGYYQEAGFDVEIRSALKNRTEILSAVEEVASGRADYGIGATDVLLARNRGVPLVIVTVVFQKSAAGFFIRKDTQFTSLADLTRLRVARRVDSLIDIEFQAMLKSEGIDPDLIHPYPHRGGVDHLVNGEVDVMPGYSLAAPFALKDLGLEFTILTPWRYGIDFYGDSLFIHQRLIDRNPDAVSRFAAATRKGWKYALDHPDEMVKRIATELERKVISVDLVAFNRFQVEEVRNLTLYPLVSIGHLNPARWRRTQNHLTKLGLVSGTVNWDEFIFDPARKKQEREALYHQVFQAVLAVLALVVILVLLWTVALRRTVRARTASLRKEIAERQRVEQELRESEQRYRMLFQSPHDFVFLHPLITPDKPGTLFDVNDAVCQKLGYTREEILQMSPLDILQEPGAATIDEEAEALEADRELLFEKTLLARDGRSYDVEMLAHMIELEGKPFVLTIGRDITERKKAQARMLRDLKEKETLLHEIHHRVKNNMQVIASLLEMQADKINDDRLRDFLSQSQSRITAMSAVHEILYESDTLSEISLESFLATLISSLTTMFAIDPSRITIHTETDGIFLHISQASPLGLVINELLTNALKHAFPDGRQGRIDLIARRLENGIELTVRDNGVGLPTDVEEDRTASMGLQLVRRLVEQQLNGTVQFSGENGFTCTCEFGYHFDQT